MREKKINRWLLCIIGFLCGHSALMGMTPFFVPACVAVYYMKQSTFGLCMGALLGGTVLCAEQNFYSGVFEPGPYVMGWEPMSVFSYVTKYSVIAVVLLLCLHGVERRLAYRPSNKRKPDDHTYGFRHSNRRPWILLLCGGLVCALAAMWNLTIYDALDATLLAVCEGVLSAGALPAFSYGLRVILLGEHEKDRENEELLGVLAVIAVCFWGTPVTIGGVVTWTVMCGFYISWYALHRFGAGYGMAVTGVCGLLTAVKTGRAEFACTFVLLAIGVLLGRILTDRKKVGTIVSACLTAAAVGWLYDDYFLTTEGIKTVGSAVLLFAATPKWRLSVRDGWAQMQFGTQTASEINRITAEKIREMAGAFKRIEYTLAGCGPAAGKVSLGEIGEMIGRFSDNLETVESVPVGLTERLRSEFLEQGVIMTHLSSIKNEMGHRQFYITARTVHRKILLARDAAEMMSDVLKKPMRASKDTPAIISENDHVIAFEECAAFRCTYHVRRIKKYGSNVSGDNFSVKETEDGRLVMMISDGMGSGSLASCESTLMIDTMEEMLAAGFDPSYGIAFSNRCISEKNSGRCFTTFDMGMIDLYGGTLTQYKQGAAPTYVMHEKAVPDHDGCHEAAAAKTQDTERQDKKEMRPEADVEILRGATLPIGVLPEAECDVIHEQLAGGDVVVMTSDGVTICEEEMIELLTSWAEEEPKEILDHIVADVLASCGGRLSDDVTVIVVKLEAAA